MDPEEFSKVLSLIPRRQWRAGEPRTTPKGDPLTGINQGTYWTSRLIFSQNTEEKELSNFLQEMVLKFEKHKDFFSQIRSSGGSIEFFIGWFTNFNSGEIFDCQLLKDLGELGIDLSLDVYSDSQR